MLSSSLCSFCELSQQAGVKVQGHEFTCCNTKHSLFILFLTWSVTRAQHSPLPRTSVTGTTWMNSGASLSDLQSGLEVSKVSRVLSTKRESVFYSEQVKFAQLQQF